MDTHPAFNARLLLIWQNNRIYRVFVENDAIYFIKIANENLLNVALKSQGAVGGLLGAVMDKNEQARLQQKASKMEQTSPEELLVSDTHNFKLLFKSINTAQLDPIQFGRSLMMGMHFGSLQLALKDGRRMTFAFDTITDMQLP